MVSQGRAQRIAQRIQRDLSELLLFELTDPRLTGVYITDVRVDREIAFASIFVSTLEGIERKDEVLAGLGSATGFIRRHLSKSITLRSMPQLRFNWDPTPEHAERMEELISSLDKDRQPPTTEVNAEEDQEE